MENYNNIDGDLETLAVLNGYSQLNPNINYLGFDGEVIDSEFIDSPADYSYADGRRPNPNLRRKRRGGSGGFRGFLQGIGISQNASQERRALRRRKQLSS